MNAAIALDSCSRQGGASGRFVGKSLNRSMIHSCLKGVQERNEPSSSLGEHVVGHVSSLDLIVIVVLQIVQGHCIHLRVVQR